MTDPAPQPEQEYTISNSFTGEFEDNAAEFIFTIHFKGISDNEREYRILLDLLGQNFRVKAIRSRPAPAPDDASEPGSDYQAGLADGARAATLKILGFLQANLDKIDCEDSDALYDTIELLKSDEGIRQLIVMGWEDPTRQRAGEQG